MGGSKPLLIGMQFQQRMPLLSSLPIPGEGGVGFKNSRQILGPLDVAGEPKDRPRVARKKNVRQEPKYPSNRPPGTN